MYPKALADLINSLARLPGLGAKSAERLALHLVRAPAAEVRELAGSLARLKQEVHACSQCYNLADRDPCPICADPTRDRGLLAVVETPADLMALEKAGVFRGVYHVLSGTLSPQDGLGPRQLNLAELARRVTESRVREVVIATNPTSEGEATADLVAKALESLGVAVTRLGYGLPVGGDLKYMDALTLSRSLAARRRLEP